MPSGRLSPSVCLPAYPIPSSPSTSRNGLVTRRVKALERPLCEDGMILSSPLQSTHRSHDSTSKSSLRSIHSSGSDSLRNGQPGRPSTLRVLGPSGRTRSQTLVQLSSTVKNTSYAPRLLLTQPTFAKEEGQMLDPDGDEFPKDSKRAYGKRLVNKPTTNDLRQGNVRRIESPSQRRRANIVKRACGHYEHVRSSSQTTPRNVEKEPGGSFLSVGPKSRSQVEATSPWAYETLKKAKSESCLHDRCAVCLVNEVWGRESPQHEHQEDVRKSRDTPVVPAATTFRSATVRPGHITPMDEMTELETIEPVNPGQPEVPRQVLEDSTADPSHSTVNFETISQIISQHQKQLRRIARTIEDESTRFSEVLESWITPMLVPLNETRHSAPANIIASISNSVPQDSSYPSPNIIPLSVARRTKSVPELLNMIDCAADHLGLDLECNQNDGVSTYLTSERSHHQRSDTIEPRRTSYPSSTELSSTSWSVDAIPTSTSQLTHSPERTNEASGSYFPRVSSTTHLTPKIASSPFLLTDAKTLRTTGTRRYQAQSLLRLSSSFGTASPAPSIYHSVPATPAPYPRSASSYFPTQPSVLNFKRTSALSTSRDSLVGTLTPFTESPSILYGAKEPNSNTPLNYIHSSTPPQPPPTVLLPLSLLPNFPPPKSSEDVLLTPQRGRSRRSPRETATADNFQNREKQCERQKLREKTVDKELKGETSLTAARTSSVCWHGGPVWHPRVDVTVSSERVRTVKKSLEEGRDREIIQKGIESEQRTDIEKEVAKGALGVKDRVRLFEGLGSRMEGG
ncbi:hypothetical protein M501DRAFT_1017765 [Patellaria atrata CBS 101060]|uniref:Uncharacterized protein n=1 Tax=Patellaria atrata CBS 101060 TaxID=1346257 RepID=A0A9P4VQP4_9PEZI|nr:hypothetical protein M501DRAFT_1017765 [Patellaria atrata CBS 101060]